MVVKLVLDPEGDECACHPSHPPPRGAMTSDPTRLLLRHACRRQVPPWPLYDPPEESSDNLWLSQQGPNPPQQSGGKSCMLSAHQTPESPLFCTEGSIGHLWWPLANLNYEMIVVVNRHTSKKKQPSSCGSLARGSEETAYI